MKCTITAHGIKAAKNAMKNIEALGGTVDEKKDISIKGDWEYKGSSESFDEGMRVLKPLARNRAHIKLPGAEFTGDVVETKGSLVIIEYEPAETFEVPRLESVKSDAKLVKAGKTTPEPPELNFDDVGASGDVRAKAAEAAEAE